jgi:hypothetical protein
LFVGCAFGYSLHAGFFEEGVVFCHDCDGFNVGCSCLSEGVVDELFAESDAAVFRVDDDAADGADVVCELFEGALPCVFASEAEGIGVGVEDGSDGLVFVFEGEGFSWCGGVV